MGIKYLYTEDVNGMTIQNLYITCDNINFFFNKGIYHGFWTKYISMEQDAFRSLR